MALPVGQLPGPCANAGRPAASEEARAVRINVRRCIAISPLMMWMAAATPGGVDDLDPVRVLARGDARGLAQRTGRGIDGVQRNAVRLLPGGNQVAAARIDREAARPFLGRRLAERLQLAARRVHLERRERARGALGGVQVAPVGRQVQVGRPGLAREARRQRGGALLQLERAARRVPGVHVQGRVELVQQVDVPLRLVPDEVARSRLGGAHGQRRIIGREQPLVRIEAPARHVVAAQAGGEHEAVVRIGVDRVRVRARLHQLLDRPHRAVLADGVDRDLSALVGGREEPLAARVEVDVGHAVGQRRLAELLQLAGGRVDRHADHAERLRAQRGVEHALVRAHGHWHDRAADVERLHRLEHAFGAIQLEHGDLLAVGVGHVDPGGGPGLAHGGHGQQRDRALERAKDGSAAVHGLMFSLAISALK